MVTTFPVDLELKEEKEDEEAEESWVITSPVDLELKELKEEKENEEAEESLVTTSPVDLDQNDSEGSYVEPLAEGEVESSVSYCNLKKNFSASTVDDIFNHHHDFSSADISTNLPVLFTKSRTTLISIHKCVCIFVNFC